MVEDPVVTLAANRPLPEVGTFNGTGKLNVPPPPPVVATAAAGAGMLYKVVPPLPSWRMMSVLTVVLEFDVTQLVM